MVPTHVLKNWLICYCRAKGDEQERLGHFAEHLSKSSDIYCGAIIYLRNELGAGPSAEVTLDVLRLERYLFNLAQQYEQMKRKLAEIASAN